MARSEQVAARCRITAALRPDVSLVDLRLDGVDDGIDVVALVRLRLGSAVPGLLLSGDTGAAELARVLDKMEPYFSKPSSFTDVSRGRPVPHTLSDEKKRAVGLTRDTWKAEVVADPDSPATLGKPLTAKDGTALDFKTLLKLGEKHAVRFPKIMTCLNLGCPLGMGLWEGVPLREVIWLTRPKENLRRVFYHGYHNDDPKQMFRSSLPVGRILEDYDDLPPVIVCYKLNGQWLEPKRGGPVRIEGNIRGRLSKRGRGNAFGSMVLGAGNAG